MADEYNSQRAADSLALIATNLGVTNDILRSINEKLDKLINEPAGPAPGVSRGGTFT